MKMRKIVTRELTYIIAGQIILCGILTAVYYFADKLRWQVFLGELAGSVFAIINFIITSVAVKLSSDTNEEGKIRLDRSTKSARLLFIAGIILACVLLRFDPLVALLALFFPRLTVSIRALIISKSAR